jgi:hypothetical protein
MCAVGQRRVFGPQAAVTLHPDGRVHGIVRSSMVNVRC